MHFALPLEGGGASRSRAHPSDSSVWVPRGAWFLLLLWHLSCPASVSVCECVSSSSIACHWSAACGRGDRVILPIALPPDTLRSFYGPCPWKCCFTWYTDMEFSLQVLLYWRFFRLHKNPRPSSCDSVQGHGALCWGVVRTHCHPTESKAVVGGPGVGSGKCASCPLWRGVPTASMVCAGPESSWGRSNATGLPAASH